MAGLDFPSSQLASLQRTTQECKPPMSPYEAAASIWAQAKHDLLDANQRRDSAEERQRAAIEAEASAWRELESQSGRGGPKAADAAHYNSGPAAGLQRR